MRGADGERHSGEFDGELLHLFEHGELLHLERVAVRGVEKGHPCFLVLRSMASMEGASFVVQVEEVVDYGQMRKECEDSGQWSPKIEP